MVIGFRHFTQIQHAPRTPVQLPMVASLKTEALRSDIKVMTWNVNGLLDKIKRGAVLKVAQRAEADILLLQETHLMGNKVPCLTRAGFGYAYHSGFTRGSRGVGILLRGYLQF